VFGKESGDGQEIGATRGEACRAGAAVAEQGGAGSADCATCWRFGANAVAPALAGHGANCEQAREVNRLQSALAEHDQVITEQSLTEAKAALEQVVQRDPNHDLALALLADLVASPYWLGYTDDRSDLDRALQLAQRALTLNPNSQSAHLTMAIVCYLTFQDARCLAEIDKVLHLNPNHANYLANSALFLVGLGEWDRGHSLLQKAMRLNPHHPGWYHYVSASCHYCRGEYEAALADANERRPDDFPRPGVLRSAKANVRWDQQTGGSWPVFPGDCSNRTR
jgi:tetratricopeptide (TPR) repeat protein